MLLALAVSPPDPRLRMLTTGVHGQLRRPARGAELRPPRCPPPPTGRGRRPRLRLPSPPRLHLAAEQGRLLIRPGEDDGGGLPRPAGSALAAGHRRTATTPFSSTFKDPEKGYLFTPVLPFTAPRAYR